MHPVPAPLPASNPPPPRPPVMSTSPTSHRRPLHHHHLPSCIVDESNGSFDIPSTTRHLCQPPPRPLVLSTSPTARSTPYTPPPPYFPCSRRARRLVQCTSPPHPPTTRQAKWLWDTRRLRLHHPTLDRTLTRTGTRPVERGHTMTATQRPRHTTRW